MRHFLVEARYAAPLDQVRAAYPRHRAWLQGTFTFTEFQPVKRQPWTEHWFSDADVGR